MYNLYQFRHIRHNSNYSIYDPLWNLRSPPLYGTNDNSNYNIYEPLRLTTFLPHFSGLLMSKEYTGPLVAKRPDKETHFNNDVSQRSPLFRGTLGYMFETRFLAEGRSLGGRIVLGRARRIWQFH
jgi:hypothetical protein